MLIQVNSSSLSTLTALLGTELPCQEPMVNNGERGGVSHVETELQKLTNSANRQKNSRVLISWIRGLVLTAVKRIHCFTNKQSMVGHKCSGDSHSQGHALSPNYSHC